MARPPLPLGTHGDIRTYAWLDDKWVSCKSLPDDAPKTRRYRARTLYRDWSGKTRPIERLGSTAAKAVRNLRDGITDAVGGTQTTLTASSRIKHGIPMYLDTKKKRRRGTTYDRYKGRCDNWVEPYFGDLLYRECIAGRLNTVFDTIRDDHPDISANTLRGIRTCIGGVLQVGVNHGVLATNPILSMDDIEGAAKRKATAFTADELLEFLRKMDGDKRAVRSDIPDLVRFLFGTGVRIGEALAVRWCDLNLTDKPVWVTNPDTHQRIELRPKSVWINGNIVNVKGQGLVRYPCKTDASQGIIGLPDFLHTLLLVRCPVGATVSTGPTEPVFPSGTLGWRHPSNVQRSVRRMRIRIGYPTFVTHIGRKTVATALAQAGHTSRQVADQLRHSNIRTTETHYIARGLANPAAAADIDALHRRRAG